MIELLVVIAIATIGVVYTSSTGEAESNVMADKSAKDALNEAEGQSGIGILGIDVVARKMRKVVGLRDGAVGADTLAEFRAEAEEDFDDTDDGDDVVVAEADAIAEDEIDDAFDDTFDEVDEDFAELDDDWEEPDEEADLVAAAQEDWSARFDAMLSQDDETTGPAPDSSAEEWDRDAEEDRAPARPTSSTGTLVTWDAPVVDEFDPEHDEIQIGYAPGEAGNGRIGIVEDPLRPGWAAVTLGGRCVAVVQDGFGKVRAHHIDLVCVEDDMAA